MRIKRFNENVDIIKTNIKNMVVKELFGKDIMIAYDGDHLSKDFGYSCANFNVDNSLMWQGLDWTHFEAVSDFSSKFRKMGSENDDATFDLYTKNTENISCFVCYNEQNKICGRRMFFKGRSMINDEEFDVPIKMGRQAKYLYGYYGVNHKEAIDEIYRTVLRKYGDGIIYTDNIVFNNRAVDHDIPMYWIMQIENTKYPKYPPVDFLNVSTEINALSNFKPKQYVLEVLKKDFKKDRIEFYPAYRYKHGARATKFDYKTWADHKGVITTPDDFTTQIQEEEEDHPGY